MGARMSQCFVKNGGAAEEPIVHARASKVPHFEPHFEVQVPVLAPRPPPPPTDTMPRGFYKFNRLPADMMPHADTMPPATVGDVVQPQEFKVTDLQPASFEAVESLEASEPEPEQLARSPPLESKPSLWGPVPCPTVWE
jgi:hypothetical protein